MTDKLRNLEVEFAHILLIVANVVLGVVPILTSSLPPELAAKLAAGLDAVYLLASQIRKALEPRGPIAAAGEGFVMGDPTNTPISPPDPVPPPAAIVAPVQTQ